MSSSSGRGMERFEAQPLAICGDVASSDRSLRNHDIGSCYDVLGVVLATTPRSQPAPLVAIVVELDQRDRFADDESLTGYGNVVFEGLAGKPRVSRRRRRRRP